MTPNKLMLKVADWVEKHPERYGFWIVQKPTSAKGCACLLGWAAYFGKMEVIMFDSVASNLGFDESGEFYDALMDVSGPHDDWQNSGKAAARLLRKLVKAQEKEARQKTKQMKKEIA